MLAVWRRWPWQGKLLSAWFVFAVGYLALAVVAHQFGVELFPAQSDVRPPFDRSACLDRKMHELYGAAVGAADLSDQARSAVAAACAREEFD
jgi:hypothetical protein